MDGQAVARPRLLLLLARAGDVHAPAVAAALACAAEQAGWGFELYRSALRRGRHFGGGDPDEAAPGWPAGSLVAGGLHVERVRRLAGKYAIAVLGDPASPLWPALEETDAEPLVRSSEPAELYAAALATLEVPLPSQLLVLDASPQGPRGVVTAPYLFPAFWTDGPALGIDVTAGPEAVAQLAELGAREALGLYIDRVRADGFPTGLELDGTVGAASYGELTEKLAARHAEWGRGVLLGDPSLVAAQLPKARRERLLPLYGRPQAEVIERSAELFRAASEPVYGRQYDDRDFFVLARQGRSFQLLDPGPPFDAEAAGESAPSRVPGETPAEPSDRELAAWAGEGVVLSTLLLWAGMIRELDCLPRLLDLAATTGLKAGLVLTSPGLAYADPAHLALLGVPVDRGGTGGLLEPLLASAGAGVAAEAELPAGALAASLSRAREEAVRHLPAEVALRGWWPLLDAPLEPVRSSPLVWREGRPTIRFTARGAGTDEGEAGAGGPPRSDARALARRSIRRLGVERLFEERRPFDRLRPGPIDPAVPRAVQAAGFDYMWTKSGFGRPAVAFREGPFVALTLTAGAWGGWSPFYTAGSARELARAERRLLRGGPGWLATTVDCPLLALSGEILEHGGRLHGMAAQLARGGRSGRLVNVTPGVVARYARLLDTRGSEPDPALS
ncbi:MAG: hypothetical protein H0U90_08545 [Actinobacteria bacterium]|nr:hypothetical protein [Actinomycetota bacterium]